MAGTSEEIRELYNRGLESHQFGLFDDAVEIFAEILRREPGNSHAYAAMGSVLSDLGRWEEALQSFDAAIRIDPADGDFYFRRGNENLDLGRNKEAEEDYSRAADLLRFNAGALYNKGLALLAVRDLETAAGSFSAAIKADPTSARAYHNRGKTLMDMGDIPAALEDFNEAIRLTPYDMAAYHNRAAALLRLGRAEEARYDFATFIKRAGPAFKSFAQDDERFLRELDEGAAKTPGYLAPKLVTYPKIDRCHREATLFVDICGSTTLVNTYGGFHFHALFSVLERIFDEHAQANSCLYRKGLGDGFMAIFPSCHSAAIACVRTMTELARHNGAARESHRINVRIGIDFGETAVSRNNDRFGVPVNVAKRIEGAMPADFVEMTLPPDQFPLENRIFISYVANRSLEESRAFESHKVGVAVLRGLERIRHELYMIDWARTAERLKGGNQGLGAGPGIQKSGDETR